MNYNHNLKINLAFWINQERQTLIITSIIRPHGCISGHAWNKRTFFLPFIQNKIQKSRFLWFPHNFIICTTTITSPTLEGKCIVFLIYFWYFAIIFTWFVDLLRSNLSSPLAPSLIRLLNWQKWFQHQHNKQQVNVPFVRVIFTICLQILS